MLLLVASRGWPSFNAASPALWHIAVFCGVALAIVPFVRAPRGSAERRRGTAVTSMGTH